MHENEKLNNSIEQMLILLSLYEDGCLEGKKELSPEESQALESARQTEKFLDKMPGGFFVYHADENEQLIYANKALLKIFGCSDLAEFRKLTGNSFKGIVHPDDLKTVEESIKEQIAQSQEDLDYVEYRIKRKDGSVRWVEDYGHFVHSEAAGDIFYVFVSDATERINLYQQKEVQRFKVIEGLSINYDSILFADLDKDEILPYRLSRRTAYYFQKRLQVRRFTELMNDYANVWVHTEDRATVSKMTTPEFIRNELSEKNSFYVNYRCIDNGVQKYLQLRIVNVGNTDHISQIVLGYRTIDDEILHEIKQKTVLEDALKNAKLASVAKNTFLSNMSHDMRTPLNAIFGYTALAGKNLRKKKLVAEYLKKIDSASNQILNLINNVLELTYMESQDFDLNESECSVKEIVQEVQDEILPYASEKEINFSLRVNTVHNGVYADKEKLKQVLRHIADNAVKYTKNGGSVVMTVTEQNKENNTKEFSTYHFTIEDTGIGISKEALPHIFEPFEREYNTTYAGIYGLGLGLTIAKQIIESMGGNIKAESEIGKGSTFTITLDLRLKDYKNTNHTEPEYSLSLKGKKILIVEDNVINLELETELLKDLGCIVDSAPNGKIAVEKIKASEAGEYWLVLMDIQMPVMDGREAAQAIRKLENAELARIPIIALSANAFESDKRASIEAGMDAHLTKPINIPLLLKTIETII